MDMSNLRGKLLDRISGLQSTAELQTQISILQEENQTLIERIQGMNLVPTIQYFARLTPENSNGGPEFSVSENEIQLPISTLLLKFPLRNIDEIKTVTDYFQDKLNFSPQNLTELMELNQTMMTSVRKWGKLVFDIGEDRNPRIRDICVTFFKNFILIQENLVAFLDQIDHPDRRELMKPIETLIQQSIVQLTQLGVLFSPLLLGDQSNIINTPQLRTAFRQIFPTTTSRFALLYDSEIHGKQALAFHQRCDNQGATVVIIRSTNGFVFGGCAMTAWESSTKYSVSNGSFLFTITNPHNIPPTKYMCPTSNPHTQYFSPGQSATFGSGHDLCVDGAFSSASYTNFPHAYTDTTGKGNATFTGGPNFTPERIEVWKYEA